MALAGESALPVRCPSRSVSVLLTVAPGAVTVPASEPSMKSVSVAVDSSKLTATKR